MLSTQIMINIMAIMSMAFEKARASISTPMAIGFKASFKITKNMASAGSPTRTRASIMVLFNLM